LYGKTRQSCPRTGINNLADNPPIFASRFASVMAGDKFRTKRSANPKQVSVLISQMTHSEPAHDNAEGKELANRITYKRKRFFLLRYLVTTSGERLLYRSGPEAGDAHGPAPALNPCSDVQN
jgi:hypothetical protein